MPGQCFLFWKRYTKRSAKFPEYVSMCNSLTVTELAQDFSDLQVICQIKTWQWDLDGTKT